MNKNIGKLKQVTDWKTSRYTELSEIQVPPTGEKGRSLSTASYLTVQTSANHQNDTTRNSPKIWFSPEDDEPINQIATQTE